MKVKYLIVGSGIGGLAAAARLKELGEEDFVIVDKVKELPLNLHNGVHYLHTDSFPRPFKFDLKEVKSTEQIWNPRKDEFKEKACVPEMMDYSMKVMGLRHPSSIMDPGSREWKTFLPISNSMNDLLMAYGEYIGGDKFLFDSELRGVYMAPKRAVFYENTPRREFHIDYEYMITTAPLNLFSEMCGIGFAGIGFKNAKLYITNYKTDNIVPNWLISLYISDNQFPVYRITVLNNIISMESLVKLTPSDEVITKYHLGRYFDYELESKSDYEWPTGRIWGLDKESRKLFVDEFEKHNIYPIGRFGLWDGKLTMDTTIVQADVLVSKLIKRKEKVYGLEDIPGRS